MKFKLEPSQLTIRLEGMEQFWALKRRLQIPVHAISDISFIDQEPAMQDFYGHVRFPGTSVSWRFLAGSYRRQGRREFWYVRLRQTGMITIILKPGTLHYSRIRLTCTPDIAEDILRWWQAAE